MPHLQEKAVDEKADHKMKVKSSFQSQSVMPITEAKKGYLGANDGLLTIKGMTSASSNAPLRAVSEDTSCTPQSHGAKQSVITPSPLGLSSGPKFGPIMTIFGNKKLVPSPIRVKRRVSHSEDDNDEAGSSPAMSQPTHLRYIDGYTTPTKPGIANAVTGGKDTDEQDPKKRLLGQLEKGELSSAKKPRMEREMPIGDEAADDDSGSESPQMNKQPVISPASSVERSEEESTTAALRQKDSSYPPYSHQDMVFPPSPFHPYQHRRQPYAPHAYGQPPYAGYPPIYGYPPVPPSHFMGRPGMPPSPYYPPPYPSHNPAMMRQYPTGVPPQSYPPAQQPIMGSRPAAAGEGLRQSPTVPDPAAIKSVAEWRQAALTNGKPPSANRCVPLKEPIPSKYWGNAEKTKDAVLPDFHRLVNFPDYLVKTRNSSDSSQSDAGKKNCVMCGKLRVCSAASYVSRGRNGAKGDGLSSADDEECSGHIIPRQNKGLCTGCDVTVWVVVTDGLEIKWCKGCKNFRPWAAFGDKGSATKCVRCRDRQREKYAMQKDELRVRKFKRSSSANSSSSSVTSLTDTKDASDDSSHLVEAAQGLHNLINASRV